MSGIASQIVNRGQVNGQDIIWAFDPVRGKKLSVTETALIFSATALNDLGWMRVGDAADALTGFVMPIDSTIVRAHIHCADDRGQAKGLDLWVEDVAIAAGDAVQTGLFMPASSGEVKIVNVTLNMDVDQGEKVQVRADAVDGRIEDIVCTLYYKWRVP